MDKSIRIIPAILTDDAGTLNNMLKQAESFTDFVQIDIMDSKFVPSRSITWEHIASISTGLHWEVHLMVEQPEKQIENYKKAGAQKVIFHFEATSTPDYVITLARQLGLSVGLAVNPETAFSKILPLTSKVDSILFMSVHPGFYGARFLPEVLEKVKKLRKARPFMALSIDGGIKENNILKVAGSGVNEICVGSAVFSQPDPAESYRRLVKLVNTNTR
ncbi:MAG: ribulose-phosphate 3-epimerase [Dehalococcoidales bacterium]|nr:ribulose-phosphate 3-epimerase [Dehalococcoidales bacterium]